MNLMAIAIHVDRVGAVGYKPLGRFPVEFKSVQPGDSVWLTRDKDGYICRAAWILDGSLQTRFMRPDDTLSLTLGLAYSRWARGILFLHLRRNWKWV